MKTQISDLINGSEYTLRDTTNAKYDGLKLVYNKPNIGGTPCNIRKDISSKVGAENMGDLNISVKDIKLTLNRHNSLSGKSWLWRTEISSEVFRHLAGYLPVWTHKGANNRYVIEITMDCFVYLYASSGKKSRTETLDEAYVEIL